jgi:hypothetical protein
MNPAAIPPDALNRFRHAALLLTQDARPRASRLLPLKEDIAALRKHGVSYRAISELLTQNGIPTSDVTVMKFSHRFLNEGRSRKSSARRRALSRANRVAPPKIVRDVPADVSSLPTQAMQSQTAVTPAENSPFKSRGPRIAKVELLKRGESV